MLQFLNILLDKPEKFERLFLIIWKSLIVIWIIGLLDFPDGVVLIPSTEEFWNVDFFKNIEAIQIAIFFSTFVLVWVGIWWFLAQIILTSLINLISISYDTAMGIVGRIIYTIVFLISLLFYLHRWAKRPKYIWNFKERKKPKRVEMSQEEESLFELRKNLNVIKFVDRFTRTAMGSAIILIVIKHEKTKYYRSRVLQYLTIILIIGIALTFKIDIQNLSSIQFILFISFWVVIFIILLVAAEIDKIYGGLDKVNSYLIKRELETEVFKYLLENSIKRVFFSRYFDFESTPYNVNLKLKKEYVDSDASRFKFHKKVIFRIFPQGASYTQIKAVVRPPKENVLLIQVSREIPDLPTQNLLAENNNILLVATDEIELFKGMQVLIPTILNGVKD